MAMGMPQSAKCFGRARLLFLLTLLLTELGKLLGALQRGRERGSTSLDMRRQLLLAQSQKERYKTGIAGSHLVSYENHPFQQSKDRRKLDEAPPFQPIRIVFDVHDLEERRNTSTVESIEVLVKKFYLQFLRFGPKHCKLSQCKETSRSLRLNSKDLLIVVTKTWRKFQLAIWKRASQMQM